MSYGAIVDMGQSQSLLQRVAACAAEQGNSNPQVWAGNNLLSLVSDSAWTGAWDYARGSFSPNRNPDLGAHDDIINDSMILSAVQAKKTAQRGTQGWPA